MRYCDTVFYWTKHCYTQKWLINKDFIFLKKTQFYDYHKISFIIWKPQTLMAEFLLSSTSSSFLVTTVSAVGSRLEADNTSLSCASFFSRLSARADNFFSRSKFLKLDFCCTSWIAWMRWNETYVIHNLSTVCVVDNQEWCSIMTQPRKFVDSAVQYADNIL